MSVGMLVISVSYVTSIDLANDIVHCSAEKILPRIQQ